MIFKSLQFFYYFRENKQNFKIFESFEHKLFYTHLFDGMKFKSF